MLLLQAPYAPTVFVACLGLLLTILTATVAIVNSIRNMKEDLQKENTAIRLEVTEMKGKVNLMYSAFTRGIGKDLQS